MVRLATRMREAVLQRDYEQAARLRDRLDRLELLTRELGVLRSPVSLGNAVYLARVGRRSCWFLIVAGSAARTLSVPRSKRSASRCLASIEASYFCDRGDAGETNRTAAQIVAAWFRTHPGESASIISPEDARQRCRDLLAM